MKWLLLVLFAIAAIPALALLYFFYAGMFDGSIDSANYLLWILCLLAILAPPALAGWLVARGHRVPAAVVLLVPAIPTILAGLLFLLLIIDPPRWN